MTLDVTDPTVRYEFEKSVADLYSELTEFVFVKESRAPSSFAFHQGLWGPSTRNATEGLAHAIETLVHGCRIGPNQHVLDAGCGVGATAISLARKYGVRVTGLTNCLPHVDVATEQAGKRGVGDLVEFMYGDFMSLPFPEGSFDVVLNQESFIYAVDKAAYLRGVNRVLKPGGRWQALDVVRRGPLASDEHRDLVAILRKGWRLPPFLVWSDVHAMLREAGFTSIVKRDVTAEALAWRKVMQRTLRSLLFLNPQISKTRPAVAGFLDGSVCFAQALSDGVLSYNFYSAMRPGR